MNDSNKALIFNIQRYSLHDGGGIRTMVFFKGCPFKCPWCSNPESLSTDMQVMKRESLCIKCSSENCYKCKNSPDGCPIGAIEKIGMFKTNDDIFEEVKKDMMFYDSSGGGLTLSGGECLFQQKPMIELLEKCHNIGINTAIETTLTVKIKDLDKLCSVTDKFLVDFKIMDREKSMDVIGIDTELMKNQFECILKRGKTVIPRIPMIPAFTDDENIKSMIRYIKPFVEGGYIKEIHLLPFHQMGSSKYKSLGIEYKLFDEDEMSDERIENIANEFEESGLNIIIRGK